jgi:uncharacterized protein (TIGR00288 family)
MAEERLILAVFIDFENLALGFRDRDTRFDIKRVLARLVEKGDIVVKRAYADWHRFGPYTSQLHESAIELIEIPRRSLTGKNSADMRLCVDAMDLCYSKSHINTFVIVSGDSDFSPLVSKLKENGRQVIGLGMRDSTSDLLRDNCHEFIYYEDLKAEAEATKAELSGTDEREKKVYSLLLESLQALRRENRDTLWSSMIKETMKRKQPSFNEAALGYKSFSRLLEDAAKRGLIELHRDTAKRTYIVSRFGPEMEKGEGAAEHGDSHPEPAGETREPPARRRRRRKKPASSSTSAAKAEAEKAPEDGEKS